MCRARSAEVPAGFTLKTVKRTPVGWQAAFTVPDESILFQGHFPGRPVIPGIGFLCMVDETLSATDGGREGPRYTSGLRRIKFRRLVEKGGTFEVLIGHERTAFGAHHITVGEGGEVVMDGHLIPSDASPSSPDPIPDTDQKPEPCQITLGDIIPHERPMRIVDDLVAIRAGEAVTRSAVLHTWPLVVEGSAPSTLLIEAVAQTAAACVGWEQVGEERARGGDYLVGIRKAHLSQPRIDAGQSFVTRVVTIQKRSNFAVFHGMVTSVGKVLCTATIQAFRPAQGDTKGS